MLDPAGNVTEAGWAVGIDDTVAWLDNHAPINVLLFVDAPLVVNNETGQRRCEKQVGQRYGRWQVSANSTNSRSDHLAGIDLLERLSARGWIYHDGRCGPPACQGKFISECYPYTTIVGAQELNYTKEHPRYKRKPHRMSTAEFLPLRNSECDELIRRVNCLKDTDPPMNLSTHPDTRLPHEVASSASLEISVSFPGTAGYRRGLRHSRVILSDPQTFRTFTGVLSSIAAFNTPGALMRAPQFFRTNTGHRAGRRPLAAPSIPQISFMQEVHFDA